MRRFKPRQQHPTGSRGGEDGERRRRDAGRAEVEHSRRVQNHKQMQEDDYERNQLHTRLESLTFQCREYSDKERELAEGKAHSSWRRDEASSRR